MDRAPDYGSGGYRFKSCRARQSSQSIPARVIWLDAPPLGEYDNFIVNNAAMHQHLHPPQESPRIPLRQWYLSNLRIFATTCFMMQAVGSIQQTAEHTSTPSKSPGVEKHATPDTGQPSRMEQSDKTKSVEKKPPAQKEKKSPVVIEKNPIKKPEEPKTDTFAPPPPLKPPTFGGAGG